MSATPVSRITMTCQDFFGITMNSLQNSIYSYGAMKLLERVEQVTCAPLIHTGAGKVLGHSKLGLSMKRLAALVTLDATKQMGRRKDDHGIDSASM